MKKRFISMLLVVLMVMSLFPGMSVSASAATVNGANTIEYTMNNGDYVLRICQKLGLNYYTCKPAIMALNNIQEGQWNKLAVGRVLTMPASDNDALMLINGAPTSAQTSGAVQTTGITGTATTGNTAYATTSTLSTSNNVQTADLLGYYLVPYTMSVGDTVSGVCNSLGVNFNVFQSFIKQVNDISSWNKVRAGQTLIIPTPVKPAVGTTCYGVMVHNVTNNDTAYSITSNAGVNYNANKKLLEALNQTSNLGAIKTGQKFFYPVPMTVSVPGTGNPGSTATTTTTTTVTDGNGTTVTQTTTTAKLYKLISNMNSADGTMLFYVDNKPVTAAPAGAKVTIETDTATGKAVQGLTVKHDGDKADLHLTGDSFIMPSCDVRVDAAIRSGHDITITSNYSGKAAASVGGISVQSAIKGAAVVIKSVDPNYEIQSITAYYKKLVSSSDKTALAISGSNAFLMPDADAFVDVVLKPVSTYAFYVNDPANGSFYLQVNGSPVTRAPKGAQVTVVAQAMNGYEPTSLSVTNHATGAKVNVFSNSFTMPAFDVDVSVEFGAKGNNIIIMPSQFGTVYAYDKTSVTKISEFVTEAATGTEVYLAAYNDEGTNVVGLKDDTYSISYEIVRNSDGLKVKVEDVTGDWKLKDDKDTDTTATAKKFTMPKGGVTVTPIITSTTSGEIFSKFFVNGEERTAADGYSGCSFSVTWNNKISEFTMTGQGVSTLKQIKSKIPVGEYIDLRFDCNDGMAFVKYRITDGKATPTVYEEATNEANLHGYFKMPNGNIEIEAYFESGKLPINYAAITGVGSVGYKDDAGNSINSAKPGDTVTVNVVPGNGHKFDFSKFDSRLMVTRSDNGVPVPLTFVNGKDKDGNNTTDPKQAVSGNFTFTMPDVAVNVQAIFEPKPFKITMKCIDQKGNDLTGKGLWQIAINGVPGIMDNGVTTVEVAYGDNITVAMTEAGWSNYNMKSFRIDGNEYIAYVDNYFYNFQMLDRWAKDLEIVATMHPSIPNDAVQHSLSANYDSTKGSVEFVILKSPTQYSDDVRANASGKLNYVHKAYTGDVVAIVVNSNDSKYEVKKGNVSVYSWWGTDADYIVPTEAYHTLKKDGKIWTPEEYKAASADIQAQLFHIFYFTMPDGDASASVNFIGSSKGIKIRVLDNKTGAPINGMIRLQVGDNFYDVAGDDNFADIPFGAQVQLWRSNQAASENKVIVKTDIKTATGTVPYFDLAGYFGGMWFSMPNENAEVYLYIDTLNLYQFNIVWDQVVHGKLIFRKSADSTAPACSLNEFAIGDTVYVWGEPDAGYSHLGIGDLKIMSGMNNIATLHKEGAPDASPIWKFTLPNNVITLQATFPAEKASEVTLTVTTAPTGTAVNVYVNSNPTKISGSSNTVKVFEGQTVYVESATDGYSISTMQSASGKGVSGATYTVPDDLTTLTDTLNVTLAQDTYPITWNKTGEGTLTVTDAGGNTISSAKAGDTVTISAAHASGYKLAAGYPKVVKTDGTEVIISGSTFTMPASAVQALAVFEADTSASVTFNNTSTGSGAVANLSIPAGTQQIAPSASMTWNFETGTQVTITGSGSYDTVRVVDSAHGFDQSGASVVYTVPSGTSNVDITLSSSAKAVTLTVTTDTKMGNISLAKSDSTSVAEPTSAFNVGDHLYLFDVPTTGYEIQSLKVIDNISGTEHTPSVKSTNGTYDCGTIPDGGVTVKASFKAKTIAVKFAKEGPGQIQAASASSSYTVTVDGTADVSVNFTFGDTVTLTPAGGYKWGATPVSGVTVTGSGDTGARQFQITTEGPFNLTLGMTAPTA